MGLRILIIGPIDEDVRHGLASLRGGAEMHEAARGADLADEIRRLSPDLAVVSRPASSSRFLDPDGPEALSRRVEHEYVRSVRYRHPLGLALLTVDGRSEMERAHGEPAAAAFDGAVASAARRALREADLLFRAGPSEIAMIFPETESAGCRAVAERLRATVAHLLVKLEAPAPPRPALPLKATASIGLAGCPDGRIRSGSDLLAAARVAMEAARAAGGDRVAGAF